MMHFGNRSKKNLSTCHPYIKEVMNEAIEVTDIDFTIICGHRGVRKQNEAFNKGFSKVKYPNSKHNSIPSRAIDIVPYYKIKPHVRWENIEDFKKLSRVIRKVAKYLGIELKWGGLFRSFKDYPHWEIK